MLSNFTWTFTVGPATGICLTAVSLAHRPVRDFGGTAGMTNTGTLTVVNGDIGTTATGTSAVTGFNDTAGDIYTESRRILERDGTIYTCTNSTTGPTSPGESRLLQHSDPSTSGRTNSVLGFGAMPPGANPANLAGLTLAPGVYTAPAGSFLIQGGDLTSTPAATRMLSGCFRWRPRSRWAARERRLLKT